MNIDHRVFKILGKNQRRRWTHGRAHRWTHRWTHGRTNPRNGGYVMAILTDVSPSFYVTFQMF